MLRIAILSMCLLVKGFCVLDVINDTLPPVNVSNASLSANTLSDPIIFFDFMGNGVSFWRDNSTNVIYSAFLPFGGTQWINQVAVSGGVEAKGSPYADINTQGYGVVTWESKTGSSDPTVLYAVSFQVTPTGVIFGGVSQASLSGQQAGSPVVAVNSMNAGNNALIAWVEKSITPNYPIWTAFLGNINPASNSAWTQQQQVYQGSANADAPAIDVNMGGDGTLIWRVKVTNFTQYYSTNFSIKNKQLGLKGVIQLPSSTEAAHGQAGNQNSGKVNVDGNGNAFASWYWSNNAGTDVMQYSTLHVGSSSWTPLGSFFSSSNNQVNNKQSINSSGFGAVVWEEDNVSTPTAAYVNTFQISNNGLSIASPIQLPGGLSTPNVFADERSNVIASWHDQAGSPYYLQVGFLPTGSNSIASVQQVSGSNTVDGGESSCIYLNQSGYGGVVWINGSQSYVQASPLKVYNPGDILFNAPTPVRYLLR